MAIMEYTTILHVQGHAPEAVADALTAIFAREERPLALRLQGTFSAVLARATNPNLAAIYRYLVCRPHANARWTPVLEVGERADGLDIELSRALAGAAVFTIFVYGDGVSGYRLARDGAAIDRYLSDPTAMATEEVTAEEIEAARGYPARFADLLPDGTAPEDFERVVLRPGWWEDASEHEGNDEDAEDADLVDETDRMRCIALALELWGPAEYPFAGELEALANQQMGPAIAIAYA